MHEGVAVRRSADTPVGDQSGQDLPERAGADAADAAQLAPRERRRRVGQCVLDALAQRTGCRRGTLIARQGEEAGALEWNVILQGPEETVFFDC